MINNAKSEEKKPLGIHETDVELENLPSNAAIDEPSFESTRGLRPKKEPEFKLGELGAALYEYNTIGLIHRGIEDLYNKSPAVENYNPIPDVPNEFLNEDDIWYFVGKESPEAVLAETIKLRREKNNANFANQFPATYMGLAIPASFIDPLNWAFPGTRIAANTKKAYLAAKQGKAAVSAGFLAKAGAQSAVLGAAGTAVSEALAQQVMETRELRDSVYSVMGGALLGGVFGAAIPAGISGYHYKSALSQLNNILAGNTPTPTKVPKNKMYMMDTTTLAEMKGDDVVSTIPEITRKTMTLSPAGGLRNSKSLMANVASTDLASVPYLLNKNITKNIATQKTVDEAISAFRGKARKTSIDVNGIFMEQQGVSGMFAGIRSRIAEATGFGLDRKQFSIAMNEVMESGHPNAHEPVNRAVTRVKEYLNDVKEKLVELGQLDKKFLDPEYDKYFTRHWQEGMIFRNHEQFKALMFKWFNEVNSYYAANQETLRPLQQRVEFAERELSKANRNIARVTKSSEYKKFQTEKLQKREAIKLKRESLKVQKKAIPKEDFDLGIETLKKEGKALKASRFERQVELEKRIAKFKKGLEGRKEKLDKIIPKKYQVPGGWIPLGNKTPLELDAAVMQTFYRTTGSDISMYINPMIAGGGKGNPDPLQARLLTIPWDYSMKSHDGDTIEASDFFSRDIWKMIDNYAGATSSRMAFGDLAKSRGLKDEAELKEWYLTGIQNDYNDMLRGVSGKKALQLGKQKKKDLKRVNDLFDQNYGIAGGKYNIFGPGFARFVRRLGQYNSGRMLGSAALSSLTDPFVAPFRQGIFNWMQDWLVPFMGQIVTLKRNSAIKFNKSEIKDAGFALETQMGFIAKKFYDNDDLLVEQKWWQSITEPAINMFGNITGMNQVNDFTQSVAGHISISRTLRNLTNKFEKGKLSKRDEKRLRSITISPESEKHIYDMWKEKGGKDKGAYYSNHTEWDINTDARAKAYSEFVNSWQKDILHSTLKSTISDQPAFYKSTLGGIIFRFKDYLLAAHSRLTLSGLQKLGQREFDVVFSMMLLTASGTMTYVLNALAKDPFKEIDLSPEKLLREGLDRSALLALAGEPINMFQKQGWLPGKTVSRYHSRGLVGNWVGPELGVADDLADTLISPLIRKLKDESNYTTKDALQILRLIPFQNLFYLRYLNEQVARQTAESLGASPKD